MMVWMVWLTLVERQNANNDSNYIQLEAGELDDGVALHLVLVGVTFAAYHQLFFVLLRTLPLHTLQSLHDTCNSNCSKVHSVVSLLYICFVPRSADNISDEAHSFTLERHCFQRLHLISYQVCILVSATRRFLFTFVNKERKCLELRR